MTNRVLFVIGFTIFKDEELLQPKEEFEKNGFAVDICSYKIGPVNGLKKAEINIELTVDDINVQDYDAIVLLGDIDEELFENKRVIEIVKEAYKNNLIIGASYRTPVILANAGILDEKRATVWIEDKDILEEQGGYYTGASMEIDGNIITTDGPHSAKMFAQKIIEMLKEKK